MGASVYFDDDEQKKIAFPFDQSSRRAKRT